MFDKDTIKKLFNVVDKALGKSANKLTETDFKKISIKSSDDANDADDAEEETYDNDDKEQEEKTEDAEDESLDEDDGSSEDELETEPEAKVQTKTNHFFLKITLS